MSVLAQPLEGSRLASRLCTVSSTVSTRRFFVQVHDSSTAVAVGTNTTVSDVVSPSSASSSGPTSSVPPGYRACAVSHSVVVRIATIPPCTSTRASCGAWMRRGEASIAASVAASHTNVSEEKKSRATSTTAVDLLSDRSTERNTPTSDGSASTTAGALARSVPRRQTRAELG